MNTYSLAGLNLTEALGTACLKDAPPELRSELATFARSFRSASAWAFTMMARATIMRGRC